MSNTSHGYVFMSHKIIKADMLFRREPIRAQIRRQPADTSLFTATHAAGWMNQMESNQNQNQNQTKRRH